MTHWLQGILDRHTSRKNAMSQGRGEVCQCEDCRAIRKVIAEIEDEQLEAKVGLGREQ